MIKKQNKIWKTNPFAIAWKKKNEKLNKKLSENNVWLNIFKN